MENIRIKRKRSGNWLEEDKTLLKELVKRKVAVVENKNCDTNTNQKKMKAWQEIEESFNTLCQGGPRNVSQLKSQWTFTKVQAKKEHSDQRKLINQTGGGPKPPDIEISSNDISVWLPNEFIIDSNEFDSDAVVTEYIAPDSVGSGAAALDAVVCKPNTSKIIEQSSPNTTEKCDTDLGEILGSVAETNCAESEIAMKKNIKKKKKFPVLCQSVASSKIKIISDVQLKNLEELHLIQMENERKRSRNLDLEYEILQEKKNQIKKTPDDKD